MAEVSEKKNKGVTPPPPGEELARGGPALRPDAAKAADPFFSGRKHFPELDGLRGVAILLVLATHYVMVAPTANWFERGVKSICNHGWAGVDLFFVLSGFLITGILYDCKGQEGYFKNFYARRFLRIFPLYYGFLTVLLLGMLAVTLMSNQLGGPPHLANLWRVQPYLWTYTFNIACAFGHGSAHLGQLWSLSVEEQFYMVWPLVIFACSRKTAMRVCVVLIFTALLLRLLLTLFLPQVDVYFLTPTRMDPLAMGALAALLIRAPSGVRPFTRAIGGIFLGASLLLVLRFSLALFAKVLARTPANTPRTVAALPFWKYLWDNTFIFSVVGVFFVCLLLLTILPGSALQRPFSNAFSSRPLRTAGKYSYGWYVFHFPLWTFSLTLLARVRELRTVHNSLGTYLLLVAVNFLVSLGLAVGSYHLYEKHFLKLKRNFPERAATPKINGIGKMASK
jgi:peptidoglycan/LPS O-acetylase OafA/YrhL